MILYIYMYSNILYIW